MIVCSPERFDALTRATELASVTKDLSEALEVLGPRILAFVMAQTRPVDVRCDKWAPPGRVYLVTDGGVTVHPPDQIADKEKAPTPARE